MGDRAEKVILEDVEKDGDVLLLADGRRLSVSPDDATAASVWMYPHRLTLRERKVKVRGRRAAFDLTVTNEDTGDTISARLLDRPNSPRR
jgi:hypothetical protein